MRKIFRISIFSFISLLFLPGLAFAAQSSTVPTNTVSMGQEEIQAALSHAVNASQFGFNSDSDNLDLLPNTPSAVALLSIFADGGDMSSGFVSGHAFVTVENVSNFDIQIGNLIVDPGGTVSLGTWGNQEEEHVGLWYNLEEYFVDHQDSWPNRTSVSWIMTSGDLSDFDYYASTHDYWSDFSNCSSFAAGIWNSTVDYSYALDPSGAFGPDLPSELEDDIMDEFPSTYQIGAAIPHNVYTVYYADGNDEPIESGVFN